MAGNKSSLSLFTNVVIVLFPGCSTRNMVTSLVGGEGRRGGGSHKSRTTTPG